MISSAGCWACVWARVSWGGEGWGVEEELRQEVGQEQEEEQELGQGLF